MANKFHQKQSKGKPPPTGQRGPTPGVGSEKTAAWPGVPGKTQPKDRSNGVKKVKGHVRKEGI
jgi:hypothetical protein